MNIGGLFFYLYKKSDSASQIEKINHTGWHADPKVIARI